MNARRLGIGDLIQRQWHKRLWRQGSVSYHSVTIATESRTDGATTLSRDFIWIRRTCDHIHFNVHYCTLFSSMVSVGNRVTIRFSVWLVSCYAHVFVLV